jgi:bacillopeptidase F (M6 metalloprotease family)
MGGVKRRIRNGQKQYGKSSLKKRPKEFNTFWKNEMQRKGSHILQQNY